MQKKYILKSVYKPFFHCIEREEKHLNKNMHKKSTDTLPAGNDGVEVKAVNISRYVPCDRGSGKKKILDNVSLTINSGDFVAVLGVSGAGKTTFMNCINGFKEPTEGYVLFNGMDLYKNYQKLRLLIGYIPQESIVHDNLNLKDMLTFTGRLRLPRSEAKQNLDKLVEEIIAKLDLTGQAYTLIKNLSGGQKKRASIAVELLSNPQIIFLDEPTSGLDPEAERHVLKYLQMLSHKEKKTVITVTHTLQNINLFDKVIFLAPGGRLCFYGTPEEACEFFQVDILPEAYSKISADADKYVENFSKIYNGG